MELRTARGRLFFFLFLILFLPLLNSYLKFSKTSRLSNTPLAPRPIFSLHDWLNGSFQAGRNDYTNDNIAFRPDFIRFNNQFDYSLFGIVHAPNVVSAPGTYLYYDEFVDECTGSNYQGDNFFKDLAIKLKAVQDTLESSGKTFVWLIEPSKASYYYDHLPDGKRCSLDAKTNLNAMKHLFDSTGVHYIDFNYWYVLLRDKMIHPPFTKQGIHWSIYGAQYASDSIIRYIERVRNISMPHRVVTGVEMSKHPRKMDDDVERLLNLIFPLDTSDFWYPVFHYESDSTKTKPRTIYMGDSFTWPLLDNGIMQTNTDPQFWFYFREVYDTNYEKGPVTYDMPGYDWKAVVDKADCIIISYTPPQLKRSIGSGFVEALYDYYYPPKNIELLKIKQNLIVSFIF